MTSSEHQRARERDPKLRPVSRALFQRLLAVWSSSSSYSSFCDRVRRCWRLSLFGRWWLAQPWLIHRGRAGLDIEAPSRHQKLELDGGGWSFKLKWFLWWVSASWFGTFCELCLPTWFVEGKWLYFAAPDGDFGASSQKLSLMGDLRLPWFKDVSFCVPSCAKHRYS